MKDKKTRMIMYFMLFLIISIPFAIADSFASINKGIPSITGRDIDQNSDGSVTIENGFGLDLGFVSDSIDLPSPANICTQKSEDIEDFLDMMENDIIKTLADISNTLYALTTVASTINTIISGLSCIFPGSSPSAGGLCKLPPPYGLALCGFITAIANVWAGVFKVFSMLSTLLMCGQGEYQLGWWQWCSGSLLGPISAKPFDNIYTALSCLCPTAILFNLRKLKLMYQTFNCCVKAACTKGVSTTGCYRYLDQATCAYWEGSIVNMIIDLIVQQVGKWLMDKIVDYLVTYVFAEATRQQIISCIKLIQGAFLLVDLADTIEWVDKTFDEPDCTSLFVDSGFAAFSTGTTSVSLIDNNGLYTS